MESAQPPKRGLDVLGLAMQDVDIIKQELPNNSALGWLENTFGDAHPKAKAVMDTGKVDAVRVHLIDGTCIRGGKCPAGAPTYNSFNVLKHRAAALNKFMKAYPNVDLYVSPFLEHGNRNSATVNRWFQIIKNQIPRAKAVCSTVKGYCPRGVLSESHDAEKPGDITSPDGVSMFDIDSVKYRGMARLLSLAWSNCMNLRYTGEDEWVPPLKRTAKCTRQEIKQNVYLLTPPDPVPSVGGCKLLVSPKDVGPELDKTNAEYYYKQDDGRGNKLLLILSNRYSKIDLQTTGGQSVGTAGFYGSYNLGGYRYYIGGRYGSNYTPMQLMAQFGGEWGLAKAGGRCWLVNAVRRYPYYLRPQP